MILADTSIWIDYLKGTPGPCEMLRPHLDYGRVVAVEPVFAELLQGCRNTREYDIVMGYWNNLPQLDLTGLWIAAGAYARNRRLLEKGIGLIDVVIYLAAQDNNCRLWTLDKKLLSICSPSLLFKP
ncbi:MAG: PIN domain-containing protein [Leptospiraceae bacterium]|nr:PIN domain-containing protein [Leptospiraceae bacterium]